MISMMVGGNLVRQQPKMPDAGGGGGVERAAFGVTAPDLFLR
jgi:hypothetical protein